MFENTELLPKGNFNIAAGGFCLFDVMNFCDYFEDLLFGPSDHQRNEVYSLKLNVISKKKLQR